MRDVLAYSMSFRVETLSGIARALQSFVFLFQTCKNFVEFLIVWSMYIVSQLWKGIGLASEYNKCLGTCLVEHSPNKIVFLVKCILCPCGS